MAGRGRVVGCWYVFSTRSEFSIMTSSRGPTTANWSVTAAVLGLLAVVFCPWVLGPLGALCALWGLRHGEPRRLVLGSILICLAGMLVGIPLGFAVARWIPRV